MDRRSVIKISLTIGLAPALLPPVGFARAAGSDVIRFAIGKPAGNLDPHRYIGMWNAQSLIFEPLVRYGQNGKFEPALAQEWREDDSGKKITFRLRPGVVFSDGHPWNAEALKWNFDRWAGNKDHDWMSISTQFDKLIIVDPMTVEIHFKKPVPAALFELSVVRPVRFLSPKSVAVDGKYREPIGTGAWTLLKNTDTETVYARNDRYWGKKPAFRAIELKVIPDARSRLSALLAGDVDISGGDYVAPISPQEAKTLAKNGLGVATATGTTTFLLCFNPDRPVFQDRRVRQAIGLSIDRKIVADRLLNGLADPTSDLFPTTIPFAGNRHPVTALDLEQARRLLAQAGWVGDGIRVKDGQPLKLELVVSEEAAPGSRALSEVLQADLKQIGIEMTIRSVDHASRHSDIPARKYDMTFFLTIGAPYDPHSTLLNSFLSTTDSGADGKMFLAAEQLDPLINAAVEAVGEARAGAYQNVYDWILNNSAVVPLVSPQRIWSYGKRVKGFAIAPTEYDMPFEGITLVS